MNHHATVSQIARILRVLVTITFVCNLIALPLVPILVSVGGSGIPLPQLLASLAIPVGNADLQHSTPGTLFLLILTDAWTSRFAYSFVLTAFLLFCGGCTAVILWQARRVLGTILLADTFTQGNAHNMRRAAACCFLISGAALIRTVWGFFYYRSIAPLFTYNMLFTPLFLMGGLLCMVMSALFRQAAELKEENDLTI